MLPYFIRCGRQHLQMIEQKRYNQFIFAENTITYLPKVWRAKFLGSERLFCLIGICKFDSFQNPFAMINSLSDLYFRFQKFILLVQTKKPCSWKKLNTMEMSGAWLDIYNDIYIYILAPTWHHSQNSIAAAEAPSLNNSIRRKK